MMPLKQNSSKQLQTSMLTQMPLKLKKMLLNKLSLTMKPLRQQLLIPSRRHRESEMSWRIPSMKVLDKENKQLMIRRSKDQIPLTSILKHLRLTKKPNVMNLRPN
jgi:hypothetical protein